MKMRWMLGAVCLLLLAGAGFWYISKEPLEKETEWQEKSEETAKEKKLTEEERIRDLIESMTPEEKAAQLFMVTPEQLTGVGTVIQAGETTRKALEEYPVGGIAYFKQNLVDESQIREMLQKTQTYAAYPLFLGIDEEGGPKVARIGNHEGFTVEQFPDMLEIGQSGDLEQAYRVGTVIGEYLSDYGFNMDFAPVADVLSNPENQVIGARSFGADPKLDGEMVAQVVEGLSEKQVVSVLKHFPGHGNTQGDSHEQAVVSNQTTEGLWETELVPFQEGIKAGAPCVMAGHISLPQVTEEDVPASLSRELITGLLREQMEFDGVVITDSLGMGAITEYYSPKEAAVMAILAGCDVLLMPEDFHEAFRGILEAVQEGVITEERLDTSVYRIFKCKADANILKI